MRQLKSCDGSGVVLVSKKILRMIRFDDTGHTLSSTDKLFSPLSPFYSSLGTLLFPFGKSRQAWSCVPLSKLNKFGDISLLSPSFLLSLSTENTHRAFF